MLKVIITFVWFIMECLAKFIWWIISWSYPVIIMVTVVGIPLWLLSRKGRIMNYKKPEKKYRLSQKPTFYINSFGHRVRIDPDLEMESSVRSFLKENNLTEKDL